MCLTKAHLAAPPAAPMTVCPLNLAIWHTNDPMAPEAAETTTTSPGLGIAILSKPTQAVSPGMPATPRNAWGGSPNVSSFCRLPPGALNRSRQPPPCPAGTTAYRSHDRPCGHAYKDPLSSRGFALELRPAPGGAPAP